MVLLFLFLFFPPYLSFPLTLTSSPGDWVTGFELLWGNTQIKGKECTSTHIHRQTHTQFIGNHTHCHLDTSPAIPVLVRATHTPYSERGVTISLSSLLLMPVSVATCSNKSQRESACVWVWVWHGDRNKEEKRRTGTESLCMMCICVFVRVWEGELLRLTVCGVRSGCVSWHWL